MSTATANSVPRPGAGRIKAGLTFSAEPRRATTMASLSRIVLRSSGPHRNIPRVFSAQLRHLHETAEKPVFHWEVCHAASVCWILKEQPPSIFRTPWILRISCLQRKLQSGMHNLRSKVSSGSKRLSDTARDFCRARTFCIVSTASQCLIDISIGVSLPTRS